jgi:hypothetical protein
MNLSWPAIVTLASLVAQRSIFLFIALAAPRNIGTVEFAKFALAYAFWVNISQVVTDPLAVSAGVTSKPELHKQLCRAAVLGGLCTGGATLLAAPLLSAAGGGSLTTAYLLAGVVLLFQIPAVVLNALLYAVGLQIRAAIVTAVTSIAVTIGCALAIAFGGSASLISVFALGAAGQVLWLLLLLPAPIREDIAADLRISDLPWKTSIFPTAGTIALYTPVHVACLSILANSADGLHQTAQFSALYVVASIFLFVPAGLRPLVIPGLAGSNPGARKRALILLFGSTWSISAVLLLAVTAFPGQILGVLGPAFATNEMLLFLMAGVGVIMATVVAINYCLWANDLARRTMVQTIIYAITYLACSLYFVRFKDEGALGLAGAMAIALLTQLFSSALALRNRKV